MAPHSGNGSFSETGYHSIEYGTLSCSMGLSGLYSL